MRHGSVKLFPVTHTGRRAAGKTGVYHRAVKVLAGLRRRRARGRLIQAAGVWVACGMVVIAGAGCGYRARAASAGGGTSSCSWRLHIRGRPTATQARLVRCYLRALAHRDVAGLLAVAANIPPVRITHADLAHAADARAGLATAAFTPNPSDPTFALLTITYADGARARLGIQNMIAMGGPSVWRLVSGADAHPGPPGPSPAEMSPSAGESAALARARGSCEFGRGLGGLSPGRVLA
jgi:hypothetical protein